MESKKNTFINGEKNWLPFKPNFLLIVKLISEEFEIPQLNKKEEFGVYKGTTTNILLKVVQFCICKMLKIYLMKIPNTANGKYIKNAVMSEYNIRKIIVIAVEHAEKERISEYNVGNIIFRKLKKKANFL